MGMIPRPRHASDRGDRRRGGDEKLLGPFESQDLALEVRRHVEAGGLLWNKKSGRTFWVDSEVRGG